MLLPSVDRGQKCCQTSTMHSTAPHDRAASIRLLMSTVLRPRKPILEGELKQGARVELVMMGCRGNSNDVCLPQKVLVQT